MKRISTALGAALALTFLAGCAGNGNDRAYYGDGYGGTRYDSYGYRQQYPGYRYNGDDRRYRNNYYSPDLYYYDGRNYYRR
jgi:hypothetical protein